MLRLATGCTWGHGAEQPHLFPISWFSSSSQLKVEGWKGPPCPTSDHRAGSVWVGCSGLCPISFYATPGMKTPQTFWVPVLVHTPSTFSYLQREFLLFSFMPSAAFRFTGYQGDFGFFFLTISHQVFIHNGKSHPNQSQSSHCKSNQFHLCQPLLMSDALIPLNSWWLYSHQEFKLTLFQVNPCPPCTVEPKTGYNTAGVLSEGRGEGKNSIPPAAGVAFPSAIQVLLASFDAGVRCSSATCCLLGPAGPFLWSCFPASPSPWIQGVIPPQLQGSAFPLVELYKAPLFPFLACAEVPVNGSTALWCINHSPFSIICKATLKFTYAWHMLLSYVSLIKASVLAWISSMQQL